MVGGIGKTLITLGLLMFAFVGYQLWGTGIETARAQNSLEDQFNQMMQSTTSIATTTTTSTTTTLVTTDTTLLPPETTVATVATTSTVPVAPDSPPIPNGDVVARMRIAKIDLDIYVVEGVGTKDLAKGPGHFRETPMPGQLGNAAIAGHRTTHGAPFGDLDELQPGDLITVEMANGAGLFTYSVTGTIIVSPSEYAAVIPTVDPTIATLTLATCHPKWTSRQRMIVQAILVPEQSSQVFSPPPNTAPPQPEETLPAEQPEPLDTTAPDTTVLGTTDTAATSSTEQPAPPTTVVDTRVDNTITEDGLSGGWFDDSAAIPHAIAWGLLLLAVGIASYYVGKATKRLYVSFLVGVIPFVVVLYFFFENVNRLLPPGL